MKQERKDLQVKISEILLELNRNDDIKELVKSSLLDEYFNKTLLTKILNQSLPLDNLNVLELYNIVRLINSYKKRINAEEYFTDNEMTEAIEYKNNLKIEYNPVIELKNVIRIKNAYEEAYFCAVTYKEIYQWMKNGLLIYDMSSQRKGILYTIGKETIVIPYVNEKSIQEIKSAMLKEEFFSNMISFNVTPDYNHRLEFNEINKTLSIDTSIYEVAIVDGFHRISAILSALEENKNLQGEMMLKITNMGIKEAQRFILQEAKGNAQDKEYLEKYNPDNKITMIIDNINRMYGSEMRNVLYKHIDMDVNTPNSWIVYEMFKEGLSLSGFMNLINETDSKSELNDIEEYIVSFFNKFFMVVENNKIDINDKECLYTHPMFITGLLITAFQYFKNRDIDKEKIDKFVKSHKQLEKEKYIFSYPIKTKEKREMINRFKKLLEV